MYIFFLQPPTPKPTPTPPINLCQDSKIKFTHKGRKRQCRFIKRNRAKHCTIESAKTACPVSCRNDCTCYDTVGDFEVGGIMRNCAWVKSKYVKRCRRYESYGHCPITCRVCGSE